MSGDEKVADGSGRMDGDLAENVEMEDKAVLLYLFHTAKIYLYL